MGYSTIGNMKSLLTGITDVCIVTGCCNEATDCHHIFEGKNKQLSEKFKLMIPMCHEHHMELHNNQDMNIHFKKIGQVAFEEHIGTREQFTTIFGRNYL